MYFTQLFEQICVHYKNLENEDKQTKMKQKALIMLPASKNLLYLFTNWVFFKTISLIRPWENQLEAASLKFCV